jgi:hypothetical protein
MGPSFRSYGYTILPSISLRSAKASAAINIWVTEHELRQAHADLSKDIVQLTGGNYVAVLSVHHELHCLVSSAHMMRILCERHDVDACSDQDALRRNMHYDYYYPNSTTEDMEYNLVHMGGEKPCPVQAGVANYGRSSLRRHH